LYVSNCPVKPPAGRGLISDVVTLVTCPNELTEKTGILKEFPYVPDITPLAFKFTAKNPFDVIGVDVTANVEDVNPTEVTVPIPLPGSPTAKFVAEVILPSSPTVIWGIEELLPYTPVTTPVGDVSKVIFPSVTLGEFVTVKLDERIPIEVKPCVGSEIDAFVALVNCPFEFTVITGICVPEPYVPEETPVVARLATIVPDEVIGEPEMAKSVEVISTEFTEPTVPPVTTTSGEAAVPFPVSVLLCVTAVKYLEDMSGISAALITLNEGNAEPDNGPARNVLAPVLIKLRSNVPLVVIGPPVTVNTLDCAVKFINKDDGVKLTYLNTATLLSSKMVTEDVGSDRVGITCAAAIVTPTGSSNTVTLAKISVAMTLLTILV
jgi:hypothetical protein